LKSHGEVNHPGFIGQSANFKCNGDEAAGRRSRAAFFCHPRMLSGRGAGRGVGAALLAFEGERIHIFLREMRLDADQARGTAALGAYRTYDFGFESLGGWF
jgi:hypothetical protein